jgi:hypothetical protein
MGFIDEHFVHFWFTKTAIYKLLNMIGALDKPNRAVILI